MSRGSADVAAPRVLLAGDASARPDGLERALARAGLHVLEEGLPPSATDRGAGPDAVLITLPDATDPRLLDLLTVTLAAPPPPRIVLLRTAGPEGAVAALALGADDAVWGECHPTELAARIRARVRDRQAPIGLPANGNGGASFRELDTEGSAPLRTDEALLALCRRLAHAVGARSCSFVPFPPPDPAFYPELAHAALGGRTASMPVRSADADGQPHTVVALPVAGATRPAGMLMLQLPGAGARLDPAQLELAAGVSAAISHVLDSRDVEAPIAESRAVSPAPRAGIPGPADLDQRLREEFERARRYALGFSVVLLDVNELRLPGGDHGDLPEHDNGRPAFLREVGDAIRGVVRQPDFLSRAAGEEFALVLPETGADGARRSVVRVRDRLAGLTPARGGVAGSLCAGIATYPHPAVAEPGDLLALVEAALARGRRQTSERIAIVE